MKAFAVAVALAIADTSAAGQETVQTLLEPEAYEAVINVLFEHSEPVEGESEVVLRYLYGDEPEMQIVIGDLGNKGFTLKTWRLPEGALTILQRMDRLASEGSKLSTAEVAKSIVVVRESRTVAASSTIGQLLSERRTLPVPWGSSALTIHAPSYRLKVRSVEALVEIETRPETRRALDSSHPVVRWMAQVRAQIEQARSEQKAPAIQ